jgi:hypothetical protein
MKKIRPCPDCGRALTYNTHGKWKHVKESGKCGVQYVKFDPLGAIVKIARCVTAGKS